MQQQQQQQQQPGLQLQYPNYTFSTGVPTAATTQQQQLELQQMQLQQQQQQYLNGQGGYLQQGLSTNGFTPATLSVPSNSMSMQQQLQQQQQQHQSLPVQSIRPIQPVQVFYKNFSKMHVGANPIMDCCAPGRQAGFFSLYRKIVPSCLFHCARQLASSRPEAKGL